MLCNDFTTFICEHCRIDFIPHRCGVKRFCSRKCFDASHGTPEQRFSAKINKEGPVWNGTPCWLWTGLLDAGYGRFRIGRKMVRIHQWSYNHHIGAVPFGLELDHLCRNKHCANPLHLEPVPHKTNVLRGNSLQAINARKTHCIHGHELNGNNLSLQRGSRQCKVCKRDSYWKCKKRKA